MFRTRFFDFLLSVLFVSACGGGALRVGNPQAEILRPPDAARTVVPLEPVPLFPVVQVTVNGLSGQRFVLDTRAAPLVVFDHAGVRDLALTTRGTVSLAGNGDGKRPDADVFTGVDLVIGDISFNDMTGIVLRAGTLPNLGDDEDFTLHGAIGRDLFDRFAVTVDDEEETLVIHGPGDAIDLEGAYVFPLEKRDGRYIVDLPIRGGPGGPVFDADLHLDTGEFQWLQLIDGSHEGVVAPERGWIAYSQGVQGATIEVSAIGPSLVLDGGELGGFPVRINDTTRQSGEHGRVGDALLKRFIYTIDMPGGRLVLRPRQDSFELPPQGVVGLGGVPYDGGWLVSRIETDSPAATAGFTPGIYESVNGRAFSSMTWKEAEEELRSDPGDELLICKRAEPEPDCRTVLAVDVADPPPAN